MAGSTIQIVRYVKYNVFKYKMIYPAGLWSIHANQTFNPSETFNVANVPPVQLQLIIRGKTYEMVPTPWKQNIGAANLVIWDSKVRLRGNRYDGLSFVSIRLHEDLDQRENKEEIEFLLKIADELYLTKERREANRNER